MHIWAIFLMFKKNFWALHHSKGKVMKENASN
jgi:hypothetical protein